MSPASMATSVPVLMAMPMSAWASAGRVVDAVADHRHLEPLRLEFPDQRELVFGPGARPELGRCRRCAATAAAARSLSPVIMMTRSPRSWSAFDRPGSVLLHVVGEPEQPGDRAVDGDEDDGTPGLFEPGRPLSWPTAGMSMPGLGEEGRGCQPAPAGLSTRADTPRAVIDANSVAAGSFDARDRRRSRRRRGSVDARCPPRRRRRGVSSSFAAQSPSGTISVTCGRPSVSVPVLSRTIALSDLVRWRTSAFLMRMPRSAPMPVPTMMAVGVASPSAHGQAMTSTATAVDHRLDPLAVAAGSGRGAKEAPAEKHRRQR